MMRKTMLGACAGLSLSLFAGAALAVDPPTPFDTDVNTAINRGLDYLNVTGSYNAYPGCGGALYSTNSLARGLPLLALLEKRASGNLNDAPQGYVGASDGDKEKMRNAVACILDSVNEISQEAYYYGNWLGALSLYARTGGPGKGAPGIPNDADLVGLTDAINKLTDDLVAAQCPAAFGTPSYRGMWSYSGCGDDSSTTQFAAAGLAGAKAYYLAVGDPGARAPKITASLALAGAHYADFGSTAGSDNSSCDRIEETEKGFGYHNGYNPSLQQTSSGMWVQLLGGANVNSPGVQAYMRWLRNHYRWQDLDNMGNSWPSYSYYYYLWSSMKGLLTIQEGGIAPNAGNLGANSFGTLAPGSDPDPGDTLAGTCAVRQVHKDPATVTRPAVFGAGGAGFYSAQAQTTYFDYAHTLLGYQCADGNFNCNGAPGSWQNGAERMGWALLVLQRSTGGACADANNDGKCDEEGGGGGNEGAPILLCDANLDGKVTQTDLNTLYAMVKGKKAKYPMVLPLTSTNAWANYNSSGASANTVDINDFWQCYYVARGMLAKKFTNSAPD
jgi:hypothetical protein